MYSRRVAFNADLPAAARRNLEAAETLDTSGFRPVAGYLYGIAAECAIKALIVDLRVQHDSLLWLHFPELRTLLRDHLSGRRARPLAVVIGDDSFMNNWNVKMRYAGKNTIPDSWVDCWRDHARRVVSLIDTL